MTSIRSSGRILHTRELEKEKPGDRGEYSLSSVSVPGAGRFYEPFIRDLELLWQVAENKHRLKSIFYRFKSDAATNQDEVVPNYRILIQID